MNVMVANSKPEGLASQSLADVIPGLTRLERAAMVQLPSVHRFVGRNVKLMVQGQRLDRLQLFVRGWAMKSVGLSADRRQILGFVMAGDLEGLHSDGGQSATADVTTLTRCEIAEYSADEVLALSNDYPNIGTGLRQLMAREAAILRDQVLRLGRMTAYERVCHFFLETFERQYAGGADGTSVAFPLTQCIAADALGLSVVHVNRQVMRLRSEGLVDVDRRSLTIHDFARLQAISGYKSRRIERMPAFAGAAE